MATTSTTGEAGGRDRTARQELERVRNWRPGRVAALRDLAAGSATDIGARAAINRLGEHGTRAAIDAVRQLLADDRLTVRSEAALVLGARGTADDHELLGRYRDGSDTADRRIDFARALLAHRHGLTGQVRVVDTATRARADLDLDPIDIRRSDEPSSDAGRPLPGRAFGVELVDEGASAAAELVCGTARTLVLPTAAAAAVAAGVADRAEVGAETGTGTGAETGTGTGAGQPFVAAVGLSPVLEGEGWSEDWVALATPQPSAGLAIRVYSSSGRLQLSGTAEMADDGIRFEVLPVAGVNGPNVVLAGTVGDGRLAITEAARARRSRGGTAPVADPG